MMDYADSRVRDRKKVLLVDDSAENIHVLLGILKDDYQVIAAKNGATALEVAAESQPDLILLDVLMPDMDGYEVCDRLKNNKITADIPVIFVTALTEDVSEERGFKVGAVDYITKPISPSIVCARVRTHLKLKEATTKLEKQNHELKEAARLREDVERIMQHDLKGPLTTIIGMPSILISKENITEGQKDILNLIKDAGNLMLDMINNSHALYQMETGNYKYRPQAIDLLKIVKRVFIECTNLAKAYEIDLHLQLNGCDVSDADEFIVLGEELLTHTVLSNLLKNAVEASPPGAIVTVEAENTAQIPVVRIRNSGEVPMAIRDQFFEKYITAGKDGGTGLGTYSAYMAARTQGDKIELDTSESGVTLITLYMHSA